MNNGRKKSKWKWLIPVSIVAVFCIIVGVIVFHSVSAHSGKIPGDMRVTSGGSTDLSIVLQHVNATTDKISGMKINQTLLALSGLKQQVDVLLQNQKSIADLCSQVSEKSDNDFAHNSDVTRICADLDENNTSLDDDYELMLKAKKNRDISQMKSLLEDAGKRQKTIINDLNFLEKSD